ncbi:MAG: hypothetical protein SCK57_09315 [Bacillota bacterium]|nr:hypothetical protein [Bacillota bacterium]
MDSLTIIGLTLVVFVTLLLILFWAGFRRRVPGFQPEIQTPNPETVRIPDSLPEPLKAHYQSIFEGSEMPLVRSAVLWGTATFKISNLWMPLRYMTYYRSGEGFLRELEFFWHGKTILKGIDFFLKGIGAVQANGVIRMNESGQHVTESQWISFWAEGVITATAEITNPALRWEVVNQQQVNVYLPPASFKNKEEKECHLEIHFNTKTGRIDSIRTERYRGQLENNRIPWCIKVNRWHRKDEGWIPDYSVKWEDQKKPWCHYKLDGLVRNAPVEKSLKKIEPEHYKKETIQRKAKRQ